MSFSNWAAKATSFARSVTVRGPLVVAKAVAASEVIPSHQGNLKGVERSRWVETVDSRVERNSAMTGLLRRILRERLKES